jgi:hypothetical protein
MKPKPSDYLKSRFLKRENVPDGGAVFVITNIDEADKSVVAGEQDFCIRLTLDDQWFFEPRGPNLDRLIELLGDDFECWYQSRIGLIRAAFIANDGKPKEFLKIVPAPEITLKKKLTKKPPAVELESEIPF